MKKKYLFIFILFLIMPFSFCSAEIIEFKSGKIVTYPIIKKTENAIKVDIEGITITYYFDEIKSIDGKPVSSSVQELPSSRPLVKKAPQDIFREVSPAVVFISAQGEEGDTSLGSGIIIDSNGLVLTNYHVVQSALAVNVQLKTGEVFFVTGVAYYDPVRDICILKIDARDLPTTKLGDSDAVGIGERVYCIGNPLGLEYSFSDGMLSGKRELYDHKLLQFTAPVSPGNSGGPVINEQGEVVGLVTFLMVGGQNLNFALAINEVKQLPVTGRIKPFDEFVASATQSDFYFIAATQAYVQGDMTQAIENFNKVLELDPDNARSYAMLGMIYHELGNAHQALAYFQKVMQVAPGDTMGYIGAGKAYEDIGDTKEAIRYFKEAINIAADCHEAYGQLGFIYSAKKEYDTANDYLEKAVKLDPYYAMAYAYLGANYYELNDERAVEVSQKAIRLDPNQPLPYLVLGRIAAFAKDYTLARPYLERARDLFREQGFENLATIVQEDINTLP